MVDADVDEIGLTPEQVLHFVEHGYVLLKNAFSCETAAACREFLWERIAADGIDRHNSLSWPEKHWISESYNEDTGGPWAGVLTPRLKRAMDQLCGKDRWNPADLTCGWWVLTFPGHAMLPWAPAGHWHVDGARYVHHVDSKESGLLPIFLFNDIGPGDGGTALSPRSHQHVAQILSKVGPNGMRGGKVSATAKPWVARHKDEYVETQGNAGDVMLTHPFLMHARSKNCGHEVRFMCNPNVGLKEPMNLARDDASEYSAVEQAIVDAIAAAPQPTRPQQQKRKRDQA
ncbi:hypothetical protein SDRG_05735 [Saprolegnia diclina VS20]|uniref:Phytanoyl-CoA dioxygenase n=1 Tax=Saprolegnia diclina (strain VS20) TaxID=1156394 RepID=T0S254_SAPDV|nr:hypothetical protein SDRG_05735 [Saprolegnia diclina VS20]EQC36907.1 hypothetical protein SDRG_05735 [Saprolegnia diclina VS20]|eukprot:XP_008609688.1 hypothetical protein SDRG_05735 [Saprolegnia diclina VS20]